MSIPKEIRVHLFVRHYYCAEEARLRAVENVRPSQISKECGGGTRVHDWLENRPKSPSEIELLQRLQPYQPYKREFQGIQVVAHPDDLRIEFRKANGGYIRIVAVEEYKTTKSLRRDIKTGEWEYEYFSRRQAEFQVGIYAWVLYPILKDLGYRLSSTQYLTIYRRRDAKFLKQYKIKVDFQEIEQKISEILEYWRYALFPKPPLLDRWKLWMPKEWKCKRCDPEFKSKCIFQKIKTCVESIEDYEFWYLCYPYTDNPEKRTREIIEIAVKLMQKYPRMIPIIPHVSFDWYHYYKPSFESYEDRLIRIATWELITVGRVADKFVICYHPRSSGMLWESAFRKLAGKKVVFYNSKTGEVK